MNITKKDWFCHQCSLQFDSMHIYSLHLKLLHRHKNAKRSNKSDINSNKPISSDEKSHSNNQIALDQNKKKTFKCEHCKYNSSQRGNLNVHIASVHERKKPFKCEFCKYTSPTKQTLIKHVASVHERKKALKGD